MSLCALHIDLTRPATMAQAFPGLSLLIPKLLAAHSLGVKHQTPIEEMADEKKTGHPTKRTVISVDVHVALDIPTEKHVDLSPQGLVQLKADIVNDCFAYAQKRMRVMPLDGKEGPSMTDKIPEAHITVQEKNSWVWGRIDQNRKLDVTFEM